MKRLLKIGIYCILLLSVPGFGTAQTSTTQSVLIFTKTAGYYHKSIPEGTTATRAFLVDNGYKVTVSDSAEIFTPEFQDNFDVIIFLNTTGDILNQSQQNIMRKFVESGGGFVGVHAATDTEYKWNWYTELIGTHFESHPDIQEATIEVLNPEHNTTQMLPLQWERTDEWYNFDSELSEEFTVLCVLDETTYEGGNHAGIHPYTWCRTVRNGRMWYTAGGHTAESYREEKFMAHLLAGIKYVLGKAEH